MFVLFLNPIVAKQLLTKSEILRKANECFKDLQYKVCSNLLLEIEKIQLVESETKKNINVRQVFLVCKQNLLKLITLES